MAEFALFVSAFLAATLLPFSSEVAFVAALSSDMNPLIALIVASTGNVLAIIVNYIIGFWLREKTEAKLMTNKTGRKALVLGKKYGYWGLFLSWLPIIGDPLTFVAGLLRINFFWFVIIAGGLRVGRYLLIGLFF